MTIKEKSEDFPTVRTIARVFGAEPKAIPAEPAALRRRLELIAGWTEQTGHPSGMGNPGCQAGILSPRAPSAAVPFFECAADDAERMSCFWRSVRSDCEIKAMTSSRLAREGVEEDMSGLVMT